MIKYKYIKEGLISSFRKIQKVSEVIFIFRVDDIDKDKELL